MEAWATIKWTEARQITDLMELADVEAPDPGVTPQDYYLKTREREEFETAVLFLGQALPRYEGTAWAAHRLEEMAGSFILERADRQALDHSLRWVGEPCEEHRRAAFTAYEMATRDSPERLLSLAVFMTGGSLAPADLPPVLPEPALSGRLAACALILAAHRSGDPRAALLQSLDLGEKVAARGLEALPVQ